MEIFCEKSFNNADKYMYYRGAFEIKLVFKYIKKKTNKSYLIFSLFLNNFLLHNIIQV